MDFHSIFIVFYFNVLSAHAGGSGSNPGAHWPLPQYRIDFSSWSISRGYFTNYLVGESGGGVQHAIKNGTNLI